MGIVYILTLSDSEQPTVALEGLLDRFNGPRPTRGDGDRHPGVDHRIP
jgi:hypothetical protein